MSTAVNPHGDGRASEPIAEVLRNWNWRRGCSAPGMFHPQARGSPRPRDLDQTKPTILNSQSMRETVSKPTQLPRRRFLAVTGVTLAAALATNSARSQLAGQWVTARLTGKVGVAPGYIISGRGEHSSNPYFVPQGKPANTHPPRQRAVHGKGVMEEDTP